MLLLISINLVNLGTVWLRTNQNALHFRTERVLLKLTSYVHGTNLLTTNKIYCANLNLCEQSFVFDIFTAINPITHHGDQAMSSLKIQFGLLPWKKVTPALWQWLHGQRPLWSNLPWQLLWWSQLLYWSNLCSACYDLARLQFLIQAFFQTESGLESSDELMSNGGRILGRFFVCG